MITADDEWGEKMFSAACEQMGAEQVHRLVTAAVLAWLRRPQSSVPATGLW